MRQLFQPGEEQHNGSKYMATENISTHTYTPTHTYQSIHPHMHCVHANCVYLSCKWRPGLNVTIFVILEPVSSCTAFVTRSYSQVAITVTKPSFTPINNFLHTIRGTVVDIVRVI